MRVCELHRKRAVNTLRDIKTGSEYDLCEECEHLLHEILNGKDDGRKRTPEAPKRIKG